MNTPAVVGAIFAVFCLWMLWHAIQNYRRASASARWPQARGRMLKVELWGRRLIDGEPQEVERLSVQYEYAVNGDSHRGDTIAFYTLVYPETLNFAKKHTEQSEVTVHYHPEDPDQSVLVPGLKGKNKRYSEIIMAAIALFVAVSIAVAGVLGILG